MRSQIVVRITWSKIMAFMVLACSMYLDIFVEKKAATFYVAAPIAAALITGKQIIDAKENKLLNQQTE